MSLEDVVAHQAAVLEGFARDVTVTLKRAAGVDRRACKNQSTGRRRWRRTQRVGIFVDVPNVIYAAERRNINTRLRQACWSYFTTRPPARPRDALTRRSATTRAPKLESQRFVHHFVGHPYRIVTKPLKRFADGSMKANFDIELAIDILTMSDRLDVVVLMSGDGDFRRLVELISSRGVRVEVVAFGETASSGAEVRQPTSTSTSAATSTNSRPPVNWKAHLLRSVDHRDRPRHHVVNRAVVVERPGRVERSVVRSALPQRLAGECT